MPTPIAEQEWQLQDYIRILRHNWGLVLAGAILFGGTSALYMEQVPDEYQATARLLLERDTPPVVQFQQVYRASRWDLQNLNTEIEIMSSPPVFKEVVQKLNLAAFPPFSRAEDPAGVLRGMVQIHLLPETKLVDVVVAGTKPDLVAHIANAVADTYVRQNLERSQGLTTGGIKWLQEEVEEMDEKVREAQLKLQGFLEQNSATDFGEDRQNTLLQRIQALNAAITDTRKERIETEVRYREKHPALLELQAKEKELQLALFEQEQRTLEMRRLSIQYDALLRDVKTSEAVHSILLTRLKELSIQEGLQSSNAQVIDYAQVPRHPFRPNRPRSILFATFFGVLLGVALGILRETLNKTIRSRHEFERLLGIPFLGFLPVLPSKLLHRDDESMLILARDSLSIRHTESLRSIRTTLEFLLPTGEPTTLLITSALPEEGKSVVSANLAAALQELDRTVILIDADMRRPTVHRILKLDLEPGLSDYLEAKASAEEIVKHTRQGLAVITAGITPSQPANLLAQQRMADLMKHLSETYQYVLLDTPPVLATADTAILSGYGGQVIYVVWAGQTSQELTIAGKQRLVDVGAKIIGGIMNRTKPEMTHSYPYYYYQSAKKKHRS